MKKDRLLSLICTLLLLCFLCACQENAAQSDKEAGTDNPAPEVPLVLSHSITDITSTLPPLHTAQATPFSMTAGIHSGNAYMQDGILYVFASHNEEGAPDPRLIPFAADGTPDSANAISVPPPAEASAFYAYRTKAGSFFQLHPITGAATDYAITVTDATGAVLATAPYGEEFRPSPAQPPRCDFTVSENADGNVSVLFGNGEVVTEYTYDAAANTITKGNTVYLAEIEAFSQNRFLTFSIINAVACGNGRYFSNGDAGAFGPATILDMKTGTLSACDVTVSEDYAAMYVLYGADGQYYLTNGTTLFRYTENEAPETVLDFVACGVTPQFPYSATLWVCDAQTFYLSVADTADITGKFDFFYIRTEYVPDTDTRQVIQIDSYADDDRLQDAVAQFNRENESYKIALTSRPMAAYFSNERKLSDDLEQLILYETHPDMLILGSPAGSRIERFYDKGTFLDLTPFTPDTVFGCVTAVMEHDGALYTLPTSMALETFVCLPETCDTYLTWGRFFTIIDSLTDGEMLTSTPYVRDIIYENGIMDFFDPVAGQSYYDTQEFADVITYVDALDKWIDESAGQFHGNSYTAPPLPAWISAGSLKFLNVSLTEVQTLGTLQLLFREQPIVWCGYPARENGSADISARNVVSVFSDTDVRDGCMAFLTFLLSDEQQTQEMQYLPVTEPAMRTCLENARYAYYKTQITDAIRNASGDLTEVGILCAPDRTSRTPLDAKNAFGTSYYVNETGTPTPQTYTEIVLSDDLIESFLDFLNTCRMKANADAQILTIVTEELSYWQNGVGTLADAAKIIQSRVQIYLNETA